MNAVASSDPKTPATVIGSKGEGAGCKAGYSPSESVQTGREENSQTPEEAPGDVPSSVLLKSASPGLNVRKTHIFKISTILFRHLSRDVHLIATEGGIGRLRP